MNRNTFFVLALILFDGLAVVWGVWQFWDARPDRKSGTKGDGASEKDPGHFEG